MYLMDSDFLCLFILLKMIPLYSHILTVVNYSANCDPFGFASHFAIKAGSSSCYVQFKHSKYLDSKSRIVI